MAINIDKLVADAKSKQDTARKEADAARKDAERQKADAKVIAESKSKMAYADTLKPRLKNYEERLKFFANRIARGDKLDTLEQKEFDKLVNDYKSLNAAVDKAIKDSYDVVKNYERKVAEDAIKSQETGKQTGLDQQFGIYSGTDENGKEVTAVQSKDKTILVNQKPYNGKLTFGDTVVTYKNGKEVNRTSTTKKPVVKDTTTNKKVKTTDTATQGTMPEVPTGKPSGKPISGSFDVAAVRAGEEASMGTTPNIPAKSERDLTSILQKTEFWYDLPDYIFKTVPDLGKLLVQAVNEEWDEEKFLSKARLTTWWQQNSAPIRTRIIARAKFNELTAGGQDASKTEYAMDSAAIKRNVQTRARKMGANLDENAVNQIVSRIYDGFLENDTVAIDSFIAPYIGKVTSIVGTGLGIQPTGYTGQALQNYQALQAVAKANGLSITDVLPRFSVLPGQTLDDVVLQKLATGELDINRLAQDARMIAAQGTPDYVKGLLQQGYDLEQIYAPYKNVMAQILEVNPDEIELNDNTLRSAIGQDKEMNIFDFKKALRKDSRWQYTENAREEVANSVLGVLRDFGFQG
jgi:hypothetical protein